jgi:hypothetical protein
MTPFSVSLGGWNQWARSWLVFLDCEGVILVDAMLRGETVNSWHLHQDADRRQGAFQMSLALQEFNSNLAWAWQCKDAHKFEDWGTVAAFGWTVLPRPPYSPHLPPPDFHLFEALKGAILGTKFETDDYMIRAVRT